MIVRQYVIHYLSFVRRDSKKGIKETKNNYLKMPPKATVYGWGLLKEDSSPSLDLMRLVVDKQDNKECNKAYAEYIGNFTKQMMCYGKPGKDSCKVLFSYVLQIFINVLILQGDSGGPLSAVVKR